MMELPTDAIFLAEDQELLARAASWDQCPTLGDCSSRKLLEVTQNYGLEFATAVLYDRVTNDPKHRAFFRQVKARPEIVIPPPTLVGIVPGAFYLEHKNTGADGARLTGIVQSLNCRMERVTLDSFGSLDRNGCLLVNAICMIKDER